MVIDSSVVATVWDMRNAPLTKVNTRYCYFDTYRPPLKVIDCDGRAFLRFPSCRFAPDGHRYGEKMAATVLRSHCSRGYGVRGG